MTQFDETFDWVVVGSGAGSMASALLMKQAGKTVVILEKAQWIGGTTAKSGGVMWIPGNRFMDPGEDSLERACQYLDAVVPDDAESPGTSPARRRTYAVEAPKMLDFIVSQGVRMERGSRFWPDYYDELPGGMKTSRTVTALPFDKNELGKEWAGKLRQGFAEVPVKLDDAMKLPFAKHSWAIKRLIVGIGFKIILGKLTGKHWVTAGAALQGRMLKAVLDNQAADIRVNSPVSEVIMEGEKAVGVVTEKDGRPWRIGARLGILMNAGGFSMNQAMRDTYMPGTQSKWSNGIETDTGDMHRELAAKGAALAQMDQMVGFQMTDAPGWDTDYVKPGTQSTTAKPHAIQVDQSGLRYMNEGGSYEAFCETMLVRNRTVPAVPSWAILDQQYMDEYAVAGKGTAKKNMAKWLASGWMRKADTVGELAGIIGVPPGALETTVARWNGFVRGGRDEDFQRGERAYDNFLGDPFFKDGPNQTMGMIDKAPFYAFPVYPGDVGTYGGVVCDCDSRVLREDGSAIEGLYACGVTTASPMGRVYPGAGASVGPSMTFGWIAAKHAAGLGNQVS
ncbi:3-ketosteroid-delta-1-dehydrogenase [Novosphingobium resinovorum]|uniref:3-ketosteroid-delta-1-dehydrogenase n=1 Tax=Novosphingobium resinovorum TaxID=158500 RepID=A0A031K2B4_9SPHN|nr:FAD-binding protein [Novosphingobium resinovorum]EZP83314.1 3-ketosteroid-delta-1-dehydrogenase [Novosphingobium resinovorum]